MTVSLKVGVSIDLQASLFTGNCDSGKSISDAALAQNYSPESDSKVVPQALSKDSIVIQLRPNASRGFADHGWLVARHSFSFADYQDPAEMGWGALRVINEDRIAAGKGFGEHGHRDMEIVTYVIAGELAHRDSLGNGEVIRPGEVQRMSAGKGIRHSEYNPSETETTHLLQIWIEPSELNLAPSYEQQPLAPGLNCWRLIASPDAAQGSTLIHQDASIHAAHLLAGAELKYALDPVRLAYVQLVRGGMSLNGLAMHAGDGAKIATESALQFQAYEDCEILLFDLPHPKKYGTWS